MRRWIRDTPWWVPVIILAFGVSEPLAHLWLAYGLPEGIAHTGFRIGDTPFFLTAMQGFRPEFASPYLPCTLESPTGLAALLALPHHWLYASLGYLADHLGMPHFHALGLANGLAGMYFLVAVWGFLRAVAPTRARLAFLFFTLGGGVAGVAYVGAWIFGATASPGFEGWLHRYARYELIEGPFLAPLLVFPRLYYTLALGLAFRAMTGLAASVGLAFGREETRRGEDSRVVPGLGATGFGDMLLATLLNARVGILVLPLLCALCLFGRRPPRVRALWAAVYILTTLFTAALVTAGLAENESALINVDALLRRSVWFGSLLGATVWVLPLAGVSVWALGRGLAWPLRGLLGAGCGYLAAFAGLYFAHQVYWGNLWSGGDAAAAVAVSDWALVGAALGGVVSGQWSVVSSRSSVGSGQGDGGGVASGGGLKSPFDPSRRSPAKGEGGFRGMLEQSRDANIPPTPLQRGTKRRLIWPMARLLGWRHARGGQRDAHIPPTPLQRGTKRQWFRRVAKVSGSGLAPSRDRVMQAMALWLVFLSAVGVSAWGQGAFLRFMPERALALCGVPLALLAADGWHRLRVWSWLRGRGGRWVAWWPRVVVGTGVVSNVVAYLCFQGPLGQRPGEGAFAWTHSELVWAEDLHLIDAIEAGTVLAPASRPPLLGDVVVHRRPGTRTVLGQPTLEFAGVNMLQRIREVGAFFDPASLESGYDHHAAIDTWCVNYVLCPQTHPVDPRVLAHFRALPWLEEVLGERDIALFRVLREATP